MEFKVQIQLKVIKGRKVSSTKWINDGSVQDIFKSNLLKVKDDKRLQKEIETGIYTCTRRLNSVVWKFLLSHCFGLDLAARVNRRVHV